MPIILATWEAEIGRRMEGQGQPGLKGKFSYHISIGKKLGVLVHTCHLPYSRKLKKEGSCSRPPEQKVTSSLQNNHSKKD
jgi:hypothetical protein